VRPAVLLTGVGKRYDIVSCFAHLTRTVAADPSPLAPAQYAAHVRAPVPLVADPAHANLLPTRSEDVMRMTKRQALFIVGIAATMASMGNATPQVSRPITIVLPFPAGGATDILARTMADRMRASLGAPIVVENVPGAGGSIGVGRAARAVPDGYTISLGNWASHVGTGAIYPVQYDVLKDLEPVALISAEPLLIVSRKDLPATNLAELIAWLKANSNKASSGHPGAGTAPHMANVVFQKQTGTRFQLIPYRGTGPSMQDLVAGQIDMEIDPTSNSLPQVRAGRIRAYAVAANTRLNAAPEIPTVEEAGLPGFHASLWYGLWATKGTPKDVIGKLNGAVVDALGIPAVRKRLTDLGHELYPRDRQTPEVLAAFHKAEIEKWWPIVREAGIKPE